MFFNSMWIKIWASSSLYSYVTSTAREHLKFMSSAVAAWQINPGSALVNDSGISLCHLFFLAAFTCKHAAFIWVMLDVILTRHRLFGWFVPLQDLQLLMGYWFIWFIAVDARNCLTYRCYNCQIIALNFFIIQGFGHGNLKNKFSIVKIFGNKNNIELLYLQKISLNMDLFSVSNHFVSPNIISLKNDVIILI